MSKKERKFKDIYSHSKDKIYRLCLGFSGNSTDADDLFQEVYIKVWKHLDSFRNESEINTWIYRIATNTAILFMKKRSKAEAKTSQLLPENLKFETDNYSNAIDIEILKLYQAISGLKEKDRIIISLVLEQHSYAEIANIVGISSTNVGARINRIKKALAKKMNSNGQ